MELTEVLSKLGVPVSTGMILILLSFIKVPKIELNIWELLGKALSKGLVGPIEYKLDDLKRDVDEVKATLDNHIKESKEEEARGARARILRFNDEIIMGQEHTKEHYRDLLSTIDIYESYCKEHPEFPNNRCLLAIEHIKEVCKDKMENNSFVTIEKLVDNKRG